MILHSRRVDWWGSFEKVVETSERVEELRKAANKAKGLVRSSRDVTDLFCTRGGGKPAVCIASGPTSDHHWGWIRKVRDSLDLLACQSALPVMAANDLSPDFVCVLDPSKAAVRSHLDASKDPRCALVWAPGVARQNVSSWKGPRYCAFISRHTAVQADLPPRGDLWAEGTVAHMTADLAVKMGYDRILLVGYDFAHPGSVPYAGGRLEAEGRDLIHRVPNYNGEWIGSTRQLFYYGAEFQQHFRKHWDHVDFRKVGAEGAVIDGIPCVDQVFAREGI